jgi:hypothetical protein
VKRVIFVLLLMLPCCSNSIPATQLERVMREIKICEKYGYDYRIFDNLGYHMVYCEKSK